MKKVIAMMLTFVLVFSGVANMGVCVSAETASGNDYEKTDVYILNYTSQSIEGYEDYDERRLYASDHYGGLYVDEDGDGSKESNWNWTNFSVLNMINTRKLLEGGTGAYASIPAYCVDAVTSGVGGYQYRRVNLEDSTYFTDNEAGRLRAIMMSSFPHIKDMSIIEKKVNKWIPDADKEKWMPASDKTYAEVKNLQESEVISATQAAIWELANTEAEVYDPYLGTGGYYKESEIVASNLDIFRQKKTENTEANVTAVYNYLISLSPMAPQTTVVSDAAFGETSVNWIKEEDGTYTAFIRTKVTTDAENSDLKLTAVANNKILASQDVKDGSNTYELTLSGIEVVENKTNVTLNIDGQQYGADVFLFDPLNGRDNSQTMAGYDSSTMPVHAELQLENKENVTVEEGVALGLFKAAKVNGEATDIPVSGATFDLVKTSAAGEDTKIYTGLVTDENGKIDVVAPALAEGEKYYFVETNAPSGYKAEVKEGETVKAYVDAVNATASYYNTGDINITVHKTNTDKTVPLSGAQFELKLVKADGTSVVIKNGDSTVFTTDAEGNIAISGLIPGNYVLTEVKAPEGYEIKADQKETNLTLTGEDKGKTITVTNDITKGTGKITVTKQMGYFDTALMEVVDLIANETEYYVGIFKDDQGKQPFGTDYVKKITIKGTSSGTAVFENLPVGTYYIFETDEKGNPVPFDKAQTTNGVQWACQIADGSSQKVEFGINMTNPEGTVGLYNMYYTFPDGFYMKGEIEISKKVLVDGKETTTDEKFYAGIFKDKEGKELYRNVELVQGDSVKVEVPLGGENGDEAITYYVYETDANGNRIGEAFAYDVTGEGAVTLDKSKSTGKIELINEKETVKETEETEETEEDEETTEDETSKSTKTGDNTPIMLYLVLAVAALAGVFIVFFKKHKTE